MAGSEVETWSAQRPEGRANHLRQRCPSDENRKATWSNLCYELLGTKNKAPPVPEPLLGGMEVKPRGWMRWQL